MKKKLYKILKKEFPTETIDISDGYKKNVHVVIVSKKFEDMEDSIRLDYFFDIIKGKITKKERKRISLIMLYSVTDIWENFIC